jgi:hypothetical protein
MHLTIGAQEHILHKYVLAHIMNVNVHPLRALVTLHCVSLWNKIMGLG